MFRRKRPVCGVAPDCLWARKRGEHRVRRFVLDRREDLTGCSGTGIVAEGVQFSDGSCTVRWGLGEAGFSTTTDHESITSVQSIHGHDGRTVVMWLDG